MQDPNEVREAKPLPKQDNRNVRASKAETTRQNVNPNGLPQAAPPPQRVQPVRVENKVGRNDPCPCGSGKKYKNCHGAGQA